MSIFVICPDNAGIVETNPPTFEKHAEAYRWVRLHVPSSVDIFIRDNETDYQRLIGARQFLSDTPWAYDRKQEEK